MEKSNAFYIQENKKHWNDRVAPHAKSEFYDMAKFKAGETSLKHIELAALGDVAGKTLLHLQCHFGQDSLSWSRMGARVTGVDFSEKAIELARQLNDELGQKAEFVCCDIYDLKTYLSGEYDIVFTSYGTIVWLPDLDKWAALVAHYLKPGGVFFIAEFHPTYYMIDFDSKKLAYPYFNTGVFSEPVESTYADLDAKLKGTEYFWQHPISEVMGALLRQGLEVLDFKEYDYSPYNCFPDLVETSSGRFEVKGHEGGIPMMYSLKMRKG